MRNYLRSTLLRIALITGLFFCISFSALLGFVYFATVKEMEQQIQYRITAQIQAAGKTFREHGLEELKNQLDDFVNEEDQGLVITLLINEKGEELAGNLESWPEDVEYSGDWMLFGIESSRGLDYVNIMARNELLPNHYKLLIGYSLRGPHRTKQVILEVSKYSVLLSLFLTVIGSVMLSRVIRQRLSVVNAVCRQVMTGNLNVSVTDSGSHDAFDQLAHNVNAMLQRIAELVKGLQHTSDNIAHDLRTPLNRHRIRLDTLLKQAAPENADALRQSIEEVDTILDTLNSLLRISQAEAGVSPSSRTDFDLAESVRNVVDFYSSFAEEKSIGIITRIDAPQRVTGDKALLTQSIANLLDNAIKYTPENGTVSVSLRRDGTTVLCIITDNGVGIPAAYRDKVRERFFRMEASRSSPGTGLGLSLVEAVARLHKGTLTLEDNNPGLKTTLLLPIAA